MGLWESFSGWLARAWQTAAVAAAKANEVMADVNKSLDAVNKSLEAAVALKEQDSNFVVSPELKEQVKRFKANLKALGL
jgi:hypothetical protein